MVSSSVSPVDAVWFINEGQLMSSEGTPRTPVLVGGAGLLGCNMLVFLANTPGVEKVRIVDLKAPPSVVLRDGGIDPERIEFVQHCLGSDSVESLAEALTGADCVFSMVTPDPQMATTAEFYRTNVEGARRLAEACKRKNVPRLVHVASMAVASNIHTSREMTEENAFPPISEYKSDYDITKRKGEEIILAANEPGVFEVVSLRPGNILSSHKDFSFRNSLLIPGVTFAPWKSAPIDFIDARDVCRGLLLAAQALVRNQPGVAGQPFWITKGETFLPHNFIWQASKNLGWPCVLLPNFVVHVVRGLKWIEYKLRNALKMRVPGFPAHVFLGVCFVEQTFSSAKIERVLGFKSKVTIEESISRICDLYVREYGNDKTPARILFGMLPLTLLATACFAVRVTERMRPLR